MLYSIIVRVIHFILYFVIFIACKSYVFANSELVCENLSEVTCAPGDTTDLSGTVTESANDSIVDVVFEESKNDLITQYIKVLENPDNSYFKATVLDVLGFDKSPECLSENEDVMKKSCHLKAATGLAQFSKAILSPRESDKFNPATKLADIDYIRTNLNFTRIHSKFVDDVRENIKIPKIEKKIQQELLPTAKVKLINVLERFGLSEADKSRIYSKIRSIQFDEESCRSIDNTNLNYELEINASFTFVGQNIQMCNGLLLKGKSDYSIMSILTHEIAHSIDPCGIQFSSEALRYNFSPDIDKAEKQYPFSNLLKCLRSEKSIEAKIKPKKLFSESSKASVFCENDQIGESISDWFAAEVTGQFLADAHLKNLSAGESLLAISNLYKPLCNYLTEKDKKKIKEKNIFDVHPDLDKRIDRVILVQPELRSRLGCTKPHKKYGYCDGINPEPQFITKAAANTTSENTNNSPNSKPINPTQGNSQQ